MDCKTKQATFHDWEAIHYEDKWSIGFGPRPFAYVAARFRAIAGEAGPFGRVLEVGCGTGFFSLNLAQAGLVDELHCTDISTGMVAHSIDNGEKLGVAVTGRVADAEALCYPDASFDLVVGHAVLHHLPDVEAAFAEFARVLKPGGRLVVAGEPTRIGHWIAGGWKRVGRTGGGLMATLAGSDGEAAEQADVAALEADVDLHSFSPAGMEAEARKAGLVGINTVTEELTANWFGWVARTVESRVGLERLPGAWPILAYHLWRSLYSFDHYVAKRVVPKPVFYNCLLTATRPTADGIQAPPGSGAGLGDAGIGPARTAAGGGLDDGPR
jgi:SAM-dependent methyltransferase